MKTLTIVAITVALLGAAVCPLLAQADVDVTIGDLPPGKTVRIQFQAAVDTPAPSGVTQVSNQGSAATTNVGTVLTDDPDTGAANDATVTPLTAGHDLTITKNDGVVARFPGSTTVYTIVATNVGNQSASGVVITETVPLETTFTASLSADVWSCADGSAAGTTCQITVGTLAGGGGQATVTFGVTVNSPTSVGATSFTNTVSVADDGANGGDPTPANNSASDTDNLGPVANLTLTKTDSRLFVSPAANVTYTIAVSNAGPDPATGAHVTDTLPAELNPAFTTWTCVGAGGGTCAASGTGGIDHNVNLPVGAQVVYTLKTRLTATAAGSLANTATVTVPAGMSDPVPADNTQTDTDTIAARAVRGDFNGDGKRDLLLWNSTTGQVREWMLNGLTRTSNVLVGTQALPYRVVGTGDYDGNGVSDILWQHQPNRDVHLWLNGTATATVLPASPAGSGVAGSGDYDGDGTSDILWRNGTNGQITVWLMSAGAVGQSAVVGTFPTAWQIFSSGDLDNDGRSDIFWQNRTTGATRVWFMAGATRLSNVASQTMADLNWRVLGGGDCNNDKRSDLVWYPQTNPTSGPNIWIMNGATAAPGVVPTAPPTGATIVTTGDLNDNGRSDIVWLSPTTRQVTGWLMLARTVQSQGVIGTLPSAQWTVVRTQQ